MLALRQDLSVETVRAVLPLKKMEAGDGACAANARQAIAEIHSRLPRAGAGQLSLAAAEAGALSLADGARGRLSLAPDGATLARVED